MTFHMISGSLMGLCALYLCLRCIFPLRCSLWLKLPACILVFACAFKLQFSRLLFPGMVLPEVPAIWLIVSGWAFAVVILWALLSLACDVCLGLWRLLRGHALVLRPALRVALLFCAALALATFSAAQGVRVPPVKRVDIAVENLPPALDGFRIVQLSDMHVSALFREAWTRDVVHKANALRPDLMVLTGDIIDGSTRARARDVAPLADLRARYGVYVCLGNHEYYAGKKAWVNKFMQLGLRVLENSHTSIAVGGAKGGEKDRATLVLGGIADPTGAARMGEERADIAATFSGSPQPGPATLRLLLSHQPRLAQEAAMHGVGLQLSGHTHGGQLFPASLVVGLFNEGYLAGPYSLQGTQLYVSRGVGLWGGFPIRLGAPSEITEIILHRSGAAPAGPAR